MVSSINLGQQWSRSQSSCNGTRNTFDMPMLRPSHAFIQILVMIVNGSSLIPEQMFPISTLPTGLFIVDPRRPPTPR